MMLPLILRLLLGILFVGNSFVYAQNPFVINTIKSTEYKSIIANTTYIVADTLLPIEKAIIDKNYKKLPGSIFCSFGFVDQKYWLKTEISNTDTKPMSFYYLLANHTIPYVALFEAHNGSIKSLGESGSTFAINKRAVPSYVFTFRVDMEPQSSKTLYLLMDAKNMSLQFSLYLYGLQAYERGQNELLFIFGFFIGVLLLIFIFNLFLYVSNREKIHFYYCLYVLANCLFLLSFENLDFWLLYPNTPFLSQISRQEYMTLSAFLLLLVMQNYLQQSAANSKWYSSIKLLQWGLMLFFITNPFIVYWFSNSYATLYIKHIVQVVLMLSFLIIVVGSLVEKILQKNRAAIYFLIAFLVTLIGAFLSWLTLTGVSNIRRMPPTFLEYGIVLETVIIAFSILYRYNQYRKEKEILKKQIEEHTVRIKQQLIETQENEQKRIAQDLHDELGGNLAAIKMHLQSITAPIVVRNRVIGLIDEASNSARSIAHNLMPPEFEKYPLHYFLQKYYEQWNNQNGIIFHYRYSNIPNIELSKQTDLMVYRIILELTNNIMKHAEANEATIQLVYHEDHLNIMVEDDGKGFANEINSGHGLKNVENRVAYLGGTKQVDSSAHGTTISIMIPY
jgi:signal transduction histidine kinase